MILSFWNLVGENKHMHPKRLKTMGNEIVVVVESLPLLFPTRLRPIVYYGSNCIMIFDFFNGKLFCIDSCRIPKKIQNRVWDSMEISRTDDKISINLRRVEIVVECLEIDLGICLAKQKPISHESPPENKLISRSSYSNGMTYSNGSSSIIRWDDDTTLDCVDPMRLITTKNKVRTPGIYMATSGTQCLIKLNPRTNDPDGFYKKYFCWSDTNSLRIGTIHNDELYTQEIKSPLFDRICRFCLTEDNHLMLFILINGAGERHTWKLMFIDCNEVKIVGCIELKNFNVNMSRRWALVELTPIRKDYLTLRSSFVPPISNHFPIVLAEVIF
ncbi:MAG: hypothetical protein Hyperionvirus3_1, partial [Hyperionvirus sp.]